MSNRKQNMPRSSWKARGKNRERNSAQQLHWSSWPAVIQKHLQFDNFHDLQNLGCQSTLKEGSDSRGEGEHTARMKDIFPNTGVLKL